MRKCDMKSFWLVAVVVVNVLSVLMVGAEECETEILGMKIECTYYMTKSDPRILDPNPQCCKAIADAHKKLSCWCNSLARKVVLFPPNAVVGDTLSWPRISHCFSFCKLPFPAGYKCWKFTEASGLPFQ